MGHDHFWVHAGLIVMTKPGPEVRVHIWHTPAASAWSRPEVLIEAYRRAPLDWRDPEESHRAGHGDGPYPRPCFKNNSYSW